MTQDIHTLTPEERAALQAAEAKNTQELAELDAADARLAQMEAELEGEKAYAEQALAESEAEARENIPELEQATDTLIEGEKKSQEGDSLAALQARLAAKK